MSNIPDRVLVLVSLMTDKTYKKEIEWHLVDAPEKITKNNISHIGNMYSTELNGGYFVLYEERYESYSIYDEKPIFVSNLVLAIANRDDVPIHNVCTGRTILNDLYNSVTSQVSNFESLIDSIIEDDLSDL